MSDEARDQLLDGKVAFVTGAARGLGHAIAKRLSLAGARGTVFDVLLAADAGELPSGWNYHQGDVSRETEVQAALDATCARYGELHIAVANAGVVPPWRHTEQIDLEQWRHTFAVNVEGTAITVKTAALKMRESGGSIIAMGSLNSWQGHPRQAAYVASKHAVLGLVRSAALDLGRFNVRVNAIAPGPVLTDALLTRVNERAAQGGTPAEEVLTAMAETGALGRPASEADVAGACLFLASDLASGVTGQLIPVDAGIP